MANKLHVYWIKKLRKNHVCPDFSKVEAVGFQEKMKLFMSQSVQNTVKLSLPNFQKRPNFCALRYLHYFDKMYLKNIETFQQNILTYSAYIS